MRSIHKVSLIAVLGAFFACQDKPRAQPLPAGGSGDSRLGVQKSKVRIGGLGDNKLPGVAIDLRASPDGKTVTALLEAEKPRLEGVPPQMRMGALWVVPTTTGSAVKLATGATNMAGGSLFTADSHYALALAGYNPTSQVGELVAQDLTDLTHDRLHLGSSVTYYVPSPDGKRLAFVEEGVLKVGPLPGGPFRAVAGEVATADFTTDGRALYFRRKVAAAGALFQLSLDGVKEPRKVVDQVGDYDISEDGKRIVYLARASLGATKFELYIADAVTLKSTRVADNVLRFTLSKDGAWLARLQGDTPQQPGELWLGRVDGQGPATDKIEGKKLGDKVKDFVFAADSKRLVFRSNYRELQLVGEQLERVGELHLVTLADGADKLVQKVCPNFVFSPDGQTLAYTATTFKPMYSRDLYVLHGTQDPVKLKEWLYEYVFSPTSDRLYFRADCTREGRSCWLLSVDVVKPENPPVQEAEAVFNFKISADGKRVLYTYAHTQGETFDVSVLNLKTRAHKTLEQDIKQPAWFLEHDGSRLAFIVADKARPGVYVGVREVP